MKQLPPKTWYLFLFQIQGATRYPPGVVRPNREYTLRASSVQVVKGVNGASLPPLNLFAISHFSAMQRAFNKGAGPGTGNGM